MDATQFISRKSALFLSFALLALAPWHAEAAPALTFVVPANVTVPSIGSSYQLSVSISDGSSLAFTATVSYPNGGNQWLSVNGGCSLTPSGTTPATLNLAIGCTAGGALGNQPAQITLTALGVAQATVGVSLSNGTGVLQASPTSLSVCASPSGTTYGYVILSTASAGISFSAALNPAVTGLSVSAPSSTVALNAPVTLTLQAVAGSYPSGTVLQTTIVVAYNNTSLNIPATFTVGGACTPTGALSLTPSSVNWSYSTSNPVTQSQAVGVGVTSGATSYSAAVSNITGGTAWLSMYTTTNSAPGTGTSGAAGSTLYLQTNSNALALSTGSFSATVQVMDSNSAAGYITVNLSVNGGASGITVYPNPITIAAAVGQIAYAQTVVTVYSSIAGNVTATASGTGLQGNPTVNGNAVTAGGSTSVTLYASAANLSQNTYTGYLYITVTGTGQTLGPQAFPVSFLVGTGVSGFNGSSVAPAALQFNYEPGVGQTLPAQSIMAGGTTTFTVQSAMSNGTGWLSTNVTSGQAPEQISVIVNPASLSAGPYTGTVTVTFADGTVQVVQVYLVVATAVPQVYANPGTVIFNQQLTNPYTAVYLYASDGSSIPVTVSTSTPWLSFLTGLPTTTQAGFTVQANTASLPNGMNTGSISVAYGNSTLTIPVVVYVTNGVVTGSGYLTLTPATNPLTFSAPLGSTTPQSMTLAVSAGTTTFFTGQATESSCTGSTWLTINGTTSINSYTNQALTIAANPTGLAAGTCSGTLQFSANGVIQSVGVTLAIGGTLTVSPSSLDFGSYAAGGSTPAPLSITLTNTSSTAVGFTAAATTTNGTGTWLSVSQASGSVGANTTGSLSVSVNPANLGAGSYSGTITVTPTGGTAQNVTVTFAVTASVISAPSTPLTFSYQVGGATPSPQTVTVSGGGFSASTTSTGNWLSVSPTSSNAAATLSVMVDPTSLTTAGTSSGSITITGANGATGTVTINVSITVTAPLPTITAVQNGATFGTGPVSPGEVITITGTAIGPANPSTLTLDANGNVATTIGGVTVLIGGTAAPLYYVSSTQINAIVPYEVSGLLAPSVVVKYLGQSSNGFSLQTVVASPGIFTQNSQGTGPGAILNQNGSLNGPGQPAAKGSVIQIYMTGEGVTSPTHVTGKVNNVTNASQLPVPLLPVSARVGSIPALVTWASEAPGFVSGLMQVNVQIPATVASGNQSIVISVGTYASSNGVTVAVQ